jgi:phosphatidylserine decarboxylase
MQKIEYVDRKTGEMIRETPPGEGALKFLYHNPLGKLPLHWLVKRKFISAWYGRKMSKPGSRKGIAEFVNKFNINMNEAEKSIDQFASFNDFFYRKLKPEARKIEQGVVSPADGKIIAFEKVSDLRNFYVKGSEFTLEKFLKDSALAEKYSNASLIIVRLAPNDYHRFHFPYDGKVSACKQIKGFYYSVSPYALCEGFTRVFCENKREYCTLNTPDKGDILLCPVGATMVGSIIETYQPDSQVQKGDEMGYFAFGGSSFVILIDSDKLTIDADILENSRKGIETSIEMGQKFAS